MQTRTQSQQFVMNAVHIASILKKSLVFVKVV